MRTDKKKKYFSKKVLKEAELLYEEANNSEEIEAVRQALTMKLMFIAGAHFAFKILNNKK